MDHFGGGVGGLTTAILLLDCPNSLQNSRGRCYAEPRRTLWSLTDSEMWRDLYWTQLMANLPLSGTASSHDQKQPSRTKRVMYTLLNTHFCPIVDWKYLMETRPSVCPAFTHISQIRKWSSPAESHSSKDKNIDFPFLKMGRNIKMWTWKAFWFFPKFKQLSRSWDLSVRAVGLAHLHLASCMGLWLLCCKWKSISFLWIWT